MYKKEACSLRSSTLPNDLRSLLCDYYSSYNFTIKHPDGVTTLWQSFLDKVKQTLVPCFGADEDTFGKCYYKRSVCFKTLCSTRDDTRTPSPHRTLTVNTCGILTHNKLLTVTLPLYELSKYFPTQVLMTAYYGLIYLACHTEWSCGEVVEYTLMSLEAGTTTELGAQFVNKLPNLEKSAAVPKAIKTRLEIALISEAFYSIDEFMAHVWVTTRLAD
ncbi:hypothetical protein J6590_067314 [Homalodisca vitripennis]|nr:hypothetical protein J6590_067314 [Homalodisca vitripennis]